MKRFKNMLLLLLVGIIVVVILWGLGFRITYNPELITDWSAVGATADWVSAIATIFIPIAVVVFEHRLNENKTQISEANKATLAELKKFKDTYSDLLASMVNGETVLDGGNAFADLTEENVANYVTAAIEVTAYDVAMYFGVKKEDSIVVLDRLVEMQVLKRKDIDGIGVYSVY